jgi:hypothetical protein
MKDVEVAWNAVHDATPAGWYVGRPSYYDERREWGHVQLRSVRAAPWSGCEAGSGRR